LIWDTDKGKLLHVLAGPGECHAATFSPDGTMLATGHRDATIRFWNVATGKEIRTLTGHANRVVALAFSRDGTMLVSGSWDNVIKFWEPTTGKELGSQSRRGGKRGLAVSSDGKTMASSERRTVLLWEATTGKQLFAMQGHEADSFCVVFAPDGKILASAGDDNAVRLWDVGTGAELRTLRGHSDAIGSLAFTGDGMTLASGSNDGIVTLWEVETGKELAKLRPKLQPKAGRIHVVAFTPDGKSLALGMMDGTVRLWDVSVEPKTPGRVLEPGRGVEHIAIGGEGRWLVAGGKSETRLVDLKSEEPWNNWKVVKGSAGPVSRVGRWLVTATTDRELRLWDLQAADPSTEFRFVGRSEASWGALRGLALSPNNRWLVTAGDDTVLRLWDLYGKADAAKPRVLMEHVAGNHFVTPNGRWLVIGGRNPGAIGVWDLASKDPTKGIRGVLRKDSGYAGPQGISLNGRWLVAVGGRQGRRLWDLRAGEPFAQPVAAFEGTEHFRSMDFSPDGHWLAAGGDDGETRLFDLKSKEPGTRPRELGGHTKRLSVGELMFSPNGRWLVTGGRDQTVRVWDMKTIERTPSSVVLRGHTDWVEFLAISPDSRWLVTAGSHFGEFEPDARLWNLESNDPAGAFLVLPKHDGAVKQVVFGGRWVVTRTAAQTTRIWELPNQAAKDPGVVTERVRGQWRSPDGFRIRLTGKVTVIDAGTLQFADGTRVQTAGVTDAPDLEQNAMIDGKLYPCGKQAAQFLRELIGDRPVAFYAFGDRLERDAQNRLRGSCFVEDTSLDAELVRNGWALAHHSGVTPYEVFAREKKRGLWRGEFIIPELWRKGQRLPGESPEVEAERRVFAALADFKPAVKLDVTRPEKNVVAIKFTENARKLTDDDVRQLQGFPRLRSVNLRTTAITDAGLKHLELLTDLVELTLDWTKVSPAAVVRLVKDRADFLHLSLFGVPFKDNDLAELKNLTELRFLGLRASAVTDPGLAYLKPFTKLRGLTLMSTAVGDTGLAHLKDLTALEDLDLDRTVITDAGLPHLKGLVKLRRLQMAHTAVTDAGLDPLLGLVELQELNLRGTVVTREGAEKITKRLPGTKVGYGPAPK
jgi:WD40 repeat protein